LRAQTTVASPALHNSTTVEFWLFETPDATIKYVAKIVSPQSSIQTYMARARTRMNWNGFRELTISEIMRRVPCDYRPRLLLKLESPTPGQVIEAARKYRDQMRTQQDEEPENSACPKVVVLKNGNFVFLASTMNQTVREMEQRWLSRLRLFDRGSPTAKFDRSFHILRMEGTYTIEVLESFPKDATVTQVKAALKKKVNEYKRDSRLTVVNTIVGNSRLPTADKRAKYTFYKIFRTDTDECYIGRTTKPMEMRISDHHSKKFMQAYSSSVLFRDHHFSWKPLEVCEVETEQEADRIESKHIHQFINKGKRVVNIIDPLTHKRLRPQDQTREEVEEEHEREELEEEQEQDEEEEDEEDEDEEVEAGAGAGAGGAGAGGAGAGMA